ncbi:transposase [Paraburkholderia mimosarum]|uniref:transposase n=1 Tax=Paraburkholderia mimosarum TaxID=312026 RepID=UPI0014703AA2|nr:transposase [Paraburkholderia mimosarum]
MSSSSSLHSSKIRYAILTWALLQQNRADRIAAWAALCPGNNESAGKRKSGRTGKGSLVIRYIMCECANSAWKTTSSLATKYRSLMVRKTHKKAIIALAHKMIRLIFLLLTRKLAYHDPPIDYQAISAKKNAPRWIKQLKAIGQWPDEASASVTT